MMFIARGINAQQRVHRLYGARLVPNKREMWLRADAHALLHASVKPVWCMYANRLESRINNHGITDKDVSAKTVGQNSNLVEASVHGSKYAIWTVGCGYVVRKGDEGALQFCRTFCSLSEMTGIGHSLKRSDVCHLCAGKIGLCLAHPRDMRVVGE